MKKDHFWFSQEFEDQMSIDNRIEDNWRMNFAKIDGEIVRYNLMRSAADVDFKVPDHGTMWPDCVYIGQGEYFRSGDLIT